MAEIIVDLTNYKDKTGARVPEGSYRVVVEDVELDKSKAGNPMVNMWYRIVGGDHDGSTIVDRLTMTEKSMFRVVGFMQAIGLKTPKKKFKVNIQPWIGKALMIDVSDGEPYNGRVKSEVRGYMRVTSGSGAGAGDDVTDLEDLDTAGDSAPEQEEITFSPDSAEAVEDLDQEQDGKDETIEVVGDDVPEDAPEEPKKDTAKKTAESTEAVEAPETVDLDDIDLG